MIRGLLLLPLLAHTAAHAADSGWLKAPLVFERTDPAFLDHDIFECISVSRLHGCEAAMRFECEAHIPMGIGSAGLFFLDGDRHVIPILRQHGKNPCTQRNAVTSTIPASAEKLCAVASIHAPTLGRIVVTSATLSMKKCETVEQKSQPLSPDDKTTDGKSTDEWLLKLY